MPPFARAAGAALLLGLLAGASGCATYHPQPLDPAAVDAALAPARLEDVRVAAARLRHPLLPAVVIDGRDGFTPEEIAVMAVVVSPQLRAARDQRGVAEAQVLQAGLLPNPQLAYALDRPQGNADPTLIDGTSLGLSWEVTSLLARHDHLAAARATAGALDLNLAWQEWQVAQDARLRAFPLLSLERRLPLARAIEADLADRLALARRALGRGLQTRTDVTTAAAAWTAARDHRFALEQEAAGQRTALNVELGQPADHPLRLRAGAGFPVLPPGEESAARLLQGLETRRLDLVALTLGYESAEASLRAAVQAQFPRISLDLNRARDTSDVHTRGYGVTVDLPLFDRGQGQIALGRATRQQLFDEYVARVAEARADVVQILASLALTRAQLQTVETELPELVRADTAMAAALRSGNADPQAACEARDARLNLEMDRDRLQQDLLELGVALEIATGRPLLNHASPSP